MMQGRHAVPSYEATQRHLASLLTPAMQGELGDAATTWAAMLQTGAMREEMQRLREENEALRAKLEDWRGDAVEPIVGEYYCFDGSFRDRFNPSISFRSMAQKLGDPCIAMRFEGTRMDSRLSAFPLYVFRTPFDEDYDYIAAAAAKNPLSRLEPGPIELVLCSHDLHRVREVRARLSIHRFLVAIDYQLASRAACCLASAPDWP